jgi:hypothetical protein
MPVDIEERLRGLAATIPDPDELVGRRLRAAVARSRAPNRRLGRLLVIAATMAAALTTAAAFADSQGQLPWKFQSSHVVRLTYRVGPREVGTSRAVARRLTCARAGTVVTCWPLARTARTAATYQFVVRATRGLGTVWIFATGKSSLAPIGGLPPVIACRRPSATGHQRCETVRADTVLPTGTPIYDAVHGGS